MGQTCTAHLSLQVPCYRSPPIHLPKRTQSFPGKDKAQSKDHTMVGLELHHSLGPSTMFTSGKRHQGPGGLPTHLYLSAVHG